MNKGILFNSEGFKTDIYVLIKTDISITIFSITILVSIYEVTK